MKVKAVSETLMLVYPENIALVALFLWTNNTQEICIIHDCLIDGAKHERRIPAEFSSMRNAFFTDVEPVCSHKDSHQQVAGLLHVKSCKQS